jgi:hypothetical protein
MLEKPKTKFDLLPPFNFIGETNWNSKLRQLLIDYEVPLPTPCSLPEIMDCEKRLDCILPQPLKIFLNTLGPVDFDGLRLFQAHEIRTAESFYCSDYFSEEERKQLPHLLQVAESLADNVYVLAMKSGKCCLCSHDPVDLFEWLPSFDALIKTAVIDLSWSFYGYPDEEIEKMAEELKTELFPD